MDRMLRSGMVFAALCVVFSVSLAAEGPVLKTPTPTPVKPAQTIQQPPASKITTVPAQPATKSPATPITPVIGKKPVTRPAGRIGVIKALVSTLRVNGAFYGPEGYSSMPTVAPGGTATVSWDLSSAPNASGVHLLVHTSSLESVNCTAPPATASPDSGKYTTSPRALTLTNAYYRDRQTYYIKGCLFNRTTDPVTGQVTDSYTGDWTNMVALRVDGRPDLIVWGVVHAHIYEPFYKADLNWLWKDWNAITSYPQMFGGNPPYVYPSHSAEVANMGWGRANAVRTTLIFNGRKYLSSLRSVGPFTRHSVSFALPLDDLWRDYQQGRRITGTVYVDEEGLVEESNEWNNFRLTRVEVYRASPTNLQVVRDMRVEPARILLRWDAGNRYAISHSIMVRYTLGPTNPSSDGVITQLVKLRHQVRGGNSFVLPNLPWNQMVNHHACFRVIGHLEWHPPDFELLSAPSNEVCLTVRD